MDDNGDELTKPLLLGAKNSCSITKSKIRNVSSESVLPTMTGRGGVGNSSKGSSSSENNPWPTTASNVGFLYQKKPCHLLYDETSRLLSIVAQESTVTVMETINPMDVIGVQMVKGTNDDDDSNETCLIIYSYPSSCNRSRRCKQANAAATSTSTANASWNNAYRHERHYKLMVFPSIDRSKNDDDDDLRRITSVLQGIRAVSNLPVSRRKVLLLMNPHAGTGTAQQMYETVVQPMWEQAGLDHDVYSTTGAGHAKSLMVSHQDLLSTYEAIVTMGGDGILFEVMQGIHQRSDSMDILRQISFGIIGTGTSNGLMKSILHESQEPYGILEMSFLICRGRTTPMDLSTYHITTNPTTSHRSLIGFLSYSYAFIADVDIESEILRFLGYLRIIIWTVWRLLALRTYKVRLSYLPPPVPKTSTTSSTIVANLPPLPKITDPTPSEWKVIEDDIILIWVCQTTHTSYDVFSSPLSKLNDGLFHILLIRKSCSRYNLLKVLLRLENGTHIHTKGVEIIPCVAFRLEPLEGKWRSFNDVDGEVVEQGPIQAVINPSAINVYANVN
jgi:diacylglycerol kinase family enzyme